jgi:hypothetical protein
MRYSPAVRWLVVLALVGCGGSDRTVVRFRVAVGWVGTFNTLLGPSGCDPSHVPGLVPAGEAWRAITAGSLTVPCKNGETDIEVVAPASIVLEAPPDVKVTERFGARIVVLDRNGKDVSIGDAEVAWAFTGPIEQRWSNCHGDMDFLCGLGDTPSNTYGLAKAPGAGTITATFGGLQATRGVTVH